jgi:crotonobetainyl-CoA:carnitine CoA-transferase CaiB-like acyl-CoA transferase
VRFAERENRKLCRSKERIRMAHEPRLSEIKVVDLTAHLAGPFCTQILGHYGGEILKIEPVRNPRGELGNTHSVDVGVWLALP